MKKINILTFFLYMFHLTGFCQLNPVFNVPSPEVSSLGTYGQIPVSLFTGTPDINIPIYNLKVGKYSFPISFSYHLASVKPNTPGGCLGLGWNLMAGGYITRTVRGFYDEKMGTDGIPHGYYAYAHRMKGITYDRFKTENDSICPPNISYPNHDHDISADEFSFSFLGYSGNFYYNEDKGWTVISDQDIKVEFDESTGFLDLAQVKKRINISSWEGSNWNNRFFSKFTLVTPDGCRYTFGGLNAIDFSISYYGRNNADLIATTWKLSKIVTPDERVVEFTYDTTATMCDIKYIPQKKVLENIYCQDVNTIDYGRAGFTGHLLFPTNVKTIKTPNDTLDFIYFKDPSYSDKLPSQALFWDNNTLERDNFYFGNTMTSKSEFGQFLGGGIKSANDVAAKLRNNILHCIRLRNGASNRTFYFDYQADSRRKLSKFTVREGLPSIELLYALPPLDSLSGIPEYKFKYNDQAHMPKDYVLCNTDSWGYYTEGRIKISEKPSYSLTSPMIGGTMAEVLTEITFPTKGISKFEYENHSYSKQLSSDKTSLESVSGTVGGLRIKKITNIKADGTIEKFLSYHYTDKLDKNEISSGISSGAIKFTETYNTHGASNGKIYLYSMVGFANPVTNQNSPQVGYSSVFEETLDANGNMLGYTRYCFSNYGIDINGDSHFDEPSIFTINCNGTEPSFPYTSNSEERGKLLRKENYDKDGNITSKTEYQYERVNDNSMLMGNQRCLFLCNRPQVNISWSNMGWLTKAHLYSYMPSMEKQVQYLHGDSITMTKTLGYDIHKQINVTHEFVGSASEESKTTEFSYPYDYKDLTWMKNHHILSSVITKKETEKGYVKKEKLQYQSIYGIPYIESSQVIFDNKSAKEQYKVTKVDNYGNPVEIEKDGIGTILLWGNDGQDLVAKIENAHYDRAMYMLGIPQNVPVEIEAIEANRHKLPSAHIYIYKYDKARRLTAIEYPNGTTDYYTYDFLDRLREVYMYEEVNGQQVKHIKYKYDYGYKK